MEIDSRAGTQETWTCFQWWWWILVSSSHVNSLLLIIVCICQSNFNCPNRFRLWLKKRKGSPYSITERRVLELIPAVAVSLQVMWVINPTVGCHYFTPGLQLPVQPLRGLVPVLLLCEQRHNGCEQFAKDCYPTASQLRFERGPFCTRVQHINHLATEPPIVCGYTFNMNVLFSISRDMWAV